MPFYPTPIAGLMTFEPRIFKDARGYFYESFNEQNFEQETGVERRFVQDNQAASTQGVLRGLHFQTGAAAQAKLVRCIVGAVYDVAVDMRPGSPTLHQAYGVVLSAENHQQLYVPRGFAHGYLVLSETAVFAYKCDNFYDKSAEGGLRYDDPKLAIAWPETAGGYQVNERDMNWDLL